MPIYDYGYIRVPKSVTQLQAKYSRAKARATSQGRTEFLSFKQVVKRDLNLVLRKFQLIEKGTTNIIEVERWCKLQPFKPSKDQVVRYLRHKQATAKNKTEKAKYEVPKAYKGRKETTGKNELKRIYVKTKDSVIRKILELRSVSKMITNDLPNWTPSEDGRVHTTFGYGPPTGQFAASKPNVLNASKHTPIGQLFRGIIQASEGCLFVEFDYSRFHIATMGREAKDGSYIKFGRLDCHSIFGSHVIGSSPISLNNTDADIVSAVKEMRKDPKFEWMRNAQFKHAVLGINLGLTPIGLFRKHRATIKTIARAQTLHKVIVKMFPKVQACKEWMTGLAEEQTYLIDEWGQLREFYDVFTYRYNKANGVWEKHHGSEYEQALSHRVQGNAFGMIKSKLAQIDKAGGCEEFNFLVSIHDSLVFMPEIGKLDKCIEMVYPIMASPCERLKNEVCKEGLRVGVDVSVGRNWRKKGSKNSEGMEEVRV